MASARLRVERYNMKRSSRLKVERGQVLCRILNAVKSNVVRLNVEKSNVKWLSRKVECIMVRCRKVKCSFLNAVIHIVKDRI